jgi:hypothetical protein
MYTIKDYPRWMQLPERRDAGTRTTLRITSHGLGLTITLILCWFYVMAIAEWYGRQAYAAAETGDFSLLGGARAEFDLYLFCLPVFGFLTYWAIRLVIGASQWLMAKHRRTAS